MICGMERAGEGSRLNGQAGRCVGVVAGRRLMNGWFGLYLGEQNWGCMGISFEWFALQITYGLGLPE